jgi:precorrin-2 methylase
MTRSRVDHKNTHIAYSNERTILDVAGGPERISQKSGASYDKIYVMKLGSQVFKLEDVGGYLGTGEEMSNELSLRFTVTGQIRVELHMIRHM